MVEATSRVARKPVAIPGNVEVAVDGQHIRVDGPRGSDAYTVHDWVEARFEDGAVHFAPRRQDRQANAMAGTMRALMDNLVTGVSEGFQRKLVIKGVGYRAQIQGDTLNLTLGFSHAVHFAVPSDVQIECPTQTEVVVKGANKQRVGQVAAEIRALRPPEPYKGKGVRYDDEEILIKEAKKK
jgi:large subunit ribosomal protein L6